MLKPKTVASGSPPVLALSVDDARRRILEAVPAPVRASICLEETFGRTWAASNPIAPRSAAV
jgi:hypothetical protein